MTKKKPEQIAVLGSTGMLGYAVSEYFEKKGYKLICVKRDDFDVLKDPLDKLEKKIKNADVVINCIGILKPRVASMKAEDIFLVNATFPKNLVKLCKKLNVKCFHITSDCVFSGKKGDYTEDDYFDMYDLYGLSKSAGESSECMTIRTSFIGEEIENKYSLLEWARKNKKKSVPGFTNHKWNGMTSVYLAEILEKILREDLYKKGVFHIFSKEEVTKKELLEIISEIYELQLEIVPTKAPQTIDRTLSSKYNISDSLSKKNLEQQIREMRAFFSNRISEKPKELN